MSDVGLWIVLAAFGFTVTLGIQLIAAGDRNGWGALAACFLGVLPVAPLLGAWPVLLAIGPAWACIHAYRRFPARRAAQRRRDAPALVDVDGSDRMILIRRDILDSVLRIPVTLDKPIWSDPSRSALFGPYSLRYRWDYGPITPPDLRPDSTS